MTLNWTLATLAEYEACGITPPDTARRWTITTQKGTIEVVLQHVGIHSENFETLVRKMDVNNFLNDNSLQYLLPTEVEHE